VELCIFDMKCLPCRCSLPNKFFQHVMAAGVPVVVNGLTDMAATIAAHDAGWVLPDSSDLGALFSLTEGELMVKADDYAAALGQAMSWASEVERLWPA